MAGDHFERQHEIALHEAGLTPEEAHEQLMRSREHVMTLHIWSHCQISGQPREPGDIVRIDKATYDAHVDRLGQNALDESPEEQLARYGVVKFAQRPPANGEVTEKPGDPEVHSVTPQAFRESWDEEERAAKRGPTPPALAHELQRGRETR